MAAQLETAALRAAAPRLAALAAAAVGLLLALREGSVAALLAALLAAAHLLRGMRGGAAR